MSDPKPKTYLNCQAKEFLFPSGGTVINLGVRAEELIAFAHQHGNQRGYVNLTISKRREVGQYGQTHSVYLDTYEPKTDAPKQPAAADDDEELIAF
tara:strand:- start:20 stop:307 length:288 start_codon:yes stop_codon:yes gene_type:complete